MHSSVALKSKPQPAILSPLICLYSSSLHQWFRHSPTINHLLLRPKSPWCHWRFRFQHKESGGLSMHSLRTHFMPTNSRSRSKNILSVWCCYFTPPRACLSCCGLVCNLCLFRLQFVSHSVSSDIQKKPWSSAAQSGHHLSPPLHRSIALMLLFLRFHTDN